MSHKSCGCSQPCNCHQSSSCYEGGCSSKLDAACVVYKPYNNTSFLNCFIDGKTKESVESILEKLDSKLCSTFNFNLNDCLQTKLNLQSNPGFNLLFSRLLDYICSQSDSLVKVTSVDSTSGYLYDKIILGSGVKKEIITIGREQFLKIYLDYNEIAANLSNCIQIDCVPCDTVNLT